MGEPVTAPLREASASVLSLHCGAMVRDVGSAAAREPSGLAWRMRGSRETGEGVPETLEVAESKTGRAQAAGTVAGKRQKCHSIPSLSAARPPWQD